MMIVTHFAAYYQAHPNSFLAALESPGFFGETICRFFEFEANYGD